MTPALWKPLLGTSECRQSASKIAQPIFYSTKRLELNVIWQQEKSTITSFSVPFPIGWRLGTGQR